MFGRDQQNELDWLAFQYVAGELNTDAAEAFELRLADEQPAREAVARAIELTQLVAAAESQVGAEEYKASAGEYVVTAEKRAVAWGSRLTWMAIGGLLSLLVAVLVSNGRFGAQLPAENNVSGELATAWYQTRQELTASEEIGPLHPLSAAMLDDDEPADIAYGDEPWLSIDTPTWMTAAVAGAAGQGSGGGQNGNDPDDEESGVN